MGDDYSLDAAFRDGGDAVAVHNLEDVFTKLGNLDWKILGPGFA